METKLLLATAFAAMAVTIPAMSQNNWVKTNFPTSMPHKMHITEDGHILVGEYSKGFSNVLPYNGGLFVSPDLGETWNKIDIPDYKYTAFLEAGNEIYVFGNEANIYKTSDYENWEHISYKDIYSKDRTIKECYAVAFFNNKIYCAPFGEDVVTYDLDTKKWELTDCEAITTVDSENEEYVYLYGMTIFKERLYAYGVYGIFRLKEDNYTWEKVYDTFYACSSTISEGKLIIGHNIQGGANCMLTTKDGKKWKKIEVPAEYTNSNSVSSICGTDFGLFFGSVNGIYSVQNNNWTNHSEGYPLRRDEGKFRFHVLPTAMICHNDYLFVAGFEPNVDVGGIFKYNLKTGIAETITPAAVTVTADRLTVAGTDRAQITITTADGRTVLQHNGTEVQLDSLPKGLYIYSVTAKGKRYSGKLVR